MSMLEQLGVIREHAPTVTVIGDFLLDGWWSGHIERIAREAPAPVVDLNDRRDAPGGAANTALNLAALGARVRAVGMVGADEAGARVRSALDDAGVDISRLREVNGARTTTKVRVTAGGQLMLRLDQTHEGSWPAEDARTFIADAEEASRGVDAQLICDYGSTVLTDEVVRALANGPRPGLRVVDAHDARRWRSLRPDLVTPNATEAERLIDAELGEGADRINRAAEKAPEFLAAACAAAAVVTLDRNGTMLLSQAGDPYRTYAHPIPEKQASGAGDVFVAALTVARAAGLDLTAAADVAQLAADVAVRKPGTCVCSLGELEQWLGRPADAALDAEDLAGRLERHRRAGHRIVFTNGCFDVLHSGHTSYLRQAKRLGDVLVVAVNADESVRRLKGSDRPVNSAADRANVLAELSCVDYVTVFEENTPRALIRRVGPDVYAKGGDYSPEMLEETADVRAGGGEVVILDYVPDHSTTEIIGRIRSSAASVPSALDDDRAQERVSVS